MKSSTQKTILRVALSFGCILSSTTSHADLFTWPFVAPITYCVPESQWRKIGKLDLLEYHLTIRPEEHQFQNGDIFIMFSQQNKPNSLWLYNSDGNWTKYNANMDPMAFYSGELQPLQKIGILLTGKKLAALQKFGNGEIRVGYGLRNSESATIKDSFQNMKDNLLQSFLSWNGFIKPMDINNLCWSISEVWTNYPDTHVDTSLSN